MVQLVGYGAQVVRLAICFGAVFLDDIKVVTAVAKVENVPPILVTPVLRAVRVLVDVGVA